MPEHLIRLRAAWVAEFAGRSARIDLPTDRATLPSAAFRLHRSFRIPSIGDGEILSLVLADVEGLTSIRLDGGAVIDVRPGIESLSIPLGMDLSGRVAIALEVDPKSWFGRSEAASALWGSIAISIRGEAGA